jgi:hypothetical protein
VSRCIKIHELHVILPLFLFLLLSLILLLLFLCLLLALLLVTLCSAQRVFFVGLDVVVVAKHAIVI